MSLFDSRPDSRKLWVLPALALVIVTVVLPFAGLVGMSLSAGDGYAGFFPPTLANYAKFLAGDPPIYVTILVRSLVVALSVTALVLLLAYPIAYFLAFHGGSAKYTLLLVITLPFWTSYLLRVFSWKIMLGHNGTLNSALLSLGIIAEPLDVFLYNPVAVVITLTHAWLPFAVMPLFVSLDKIDRDLLDAARDLGLEAGAVFRRVILPLSWPGIASAACLVFVPTVADYVTPSQVGGSSGLMIGNVVQSLFGRADNPALGSAISIVTMACATAAVLAFLRLGGQRKSAP